MAVSARQAYSFPGHGSYAYGSHAYRYGQPRYVGPLASNVDGRITPVSDTYEVAAARDGFFRAYQNQLATIYAIRATHGYDPVHGGHDSHGNPVHHGLHSPHNYGLQRNY